MNTPPATPVSWSIPPSISQWFPLLAGPIGMASGQALQYLQQSVNQAAHAAKESTPGAVASQPTQGAEAAGTQPPTDWTLPAVILGGAAVIGIGYYLFEVEK